MSTPVSPIPADYPRVTAYLCIKDAAAAIAWYQANLDATLTMRIDMPGGLVGHADLQFGDSHIMISGEFPDFGCLSPGTIGGTPVALQLYVSDVDTVFARAVAAGATVQRPVANQFYGDRSGKLTDPFGHVWNIGSRIENLTNEQVRQRAAEACGTVEPS